MEDKIKEVKILTLLEPLDALKRYNTSERGLSFEEALKRQEKYGENKLRKEKKSHPVNQLLKQFTHFMALLLWAAGFLGLIAGMPDIAFASWAVIVINALFSFFQEYKADKALSHIAEMIPGRVKTYRNGEIDVISAEELTVGDVISLEAGDRVPADARVIKSDGLLLDNSMLTGVSLPEGRNEKECLLHENNITESTNLIFAGTTVVKGTADAVVYAVGSGTEIGKVLSLGKTIKRAGGTLESQVQDIVKFITKVAFTMGAAAFAMGVFGARLNLRAGFVFAVGIIAANIPEGLLPTVSLALAVGVQRMAKRGALIRKLSSVETLGAASVICTDKTGTLTQNKMTVKKIVTLDTEADFAGTGYKKEGRVSLSSESGKTSLEMLLSAASVCSEALIKENSKKPDEWKVTGDSTDASILIAAEKYGMNAAYGNRKFKRLASVPFDSDKKIMIVVEQNIWDINFRLSANIVFAKGAPSNVLSMCRYTYENGEVHTLTDECIRKITETSDRLAGEGLRVIGVSYKVLEDYDDYCDEDYDRNMVFLGLIAMYDAPFAEVKGAVKKFKRAGVKTTIVTGDCGLTAAAVAKQVGIVEDKYKIINGNEIDEMTDAEIMKLLKTDVPLIFSRTTPENKLRIVEGYKNIGEVVAFAGDGINDVLALKSSHIGIVTGEGSRSAVRESADIVLTYDDFGILTKAIEEGRSIYKNIKKFLTYILASNIPEFIPFVAMALFDVPVSLTVLQVLAIDLGTDMIPALALGAESPEDGIMEAPPRKKGENLLTKGLFIRAYGYLGIIEAALSFAIFMYVWFRAGYSFHELQALTPLVLKGRASKSVMQLYMYATSMAFASVVACQIGNVFVCRSESLPFWKMFKNRNKLIFIGVAFEILLCSAIVFFPPLQVVFGTQPIKFSDFKILAVCPVILTVLEETRKYISIKKKSKIKY